MPKPKPGEDKETYISRCISTVMNEGGSTTEQAAGKCYGMWNNAKKSEAMKAKVNSAIQEVTKMIGRMEMEDLLKAYEPELSDLVEKAKEEMKELVGDQLQFMQEIYVRFRQDGNDVEKSYDLVMTFFGREGNKMVDVEAQQLIKAIESVVLTIQNRQSSVRKQNVGDKKNIFGKPFEWTGSKWEPSEGEKEEEGDEQQELPGMEEKPEEESFIDNRSDIMREYGLDDEELEGRSEEEIDDIWEGFLNDFQDDFREDIAGELMEEGFSEDEALEQVDDMDLADISDWLTEKKEGDTREDETPGMQAQAEFMDDVDEMADKLIEAGFDEEDIVNMNLDDIEQAYNELMGDKDIGREEELSDKEYKKLLNNG